MAKTSERATKWLQSYKKMAKELHNKLDKEILDQITDEEYSEKFTDLIKEINNLSESIDRVHSEIHNLILYKD